MSDQIPDEPTTITEPDELMIDLSDPIPDELMSDPETGEPLIDPIQELYLAVKRHEEVIRLQDGYLKRQAALLDIVVMTMDELFDAVGDQELAGRYRAAVRELVRPEIEAAVEESLDEREE